MRALQGVILFSVFGSLALLACSGQEPQPPSGAASPATSAVATVDGAPISADDIRHRVLADKRQRLEREFYEECRREVAVSVDEDRFAAVELPAEAVSGGKLSAPPAFPGR